MQILSALDAVSPAFSRTKLVLFSPFRKGRTWKLAATGYLATAGTMFLPFAFIYLIFLPQVRRAGGAAVAILIAAIVAITLLSLFLFYLFTRIRFAFFDIVLNRSEFVAPVWRKYGPQSLKWTLFKVLLGTVLAAIFAAPLAVFGRHMFLLFSSISFKPGEPPSPELMSAIFASYAAFALVYLIFGLFFFANSLLSDFIVPSLALENTTLREAFHRLGRLIRNEPGQFTLYALIKLGLGLASYMGGAIAFEIAFFLALSIIALIAAAIGFLLHLIGVPTAALIVLAVILGIVCYVFFVFYCCCILVGSVLTFLESYALYFLGGRYPMLGDLLERSTPPPTFYMPPPGYPPYYPPASPAEPEPNL
jgi:hypothetical protein